jgi:hypothetical protein
LLLLAKMLLLVLVVVVLVVLAKAKALLHCLYTAWAAALAASLSECC